MQLAGIGRIAAQASGQDSQRTIRLAMICFLLLQGMDLLTTLAAFAHGGVELNPIVSSLMPWTGKAMAIIVSKFLLIALVVQFSRKKRTLYFANILYTAIVGWNLLIVFALM